MKTEDQLRLQAYLDNEVSSGDARQIASWLARDSEAKALFEELKATRSLLTTENELPAAMSDGRDFYWSKIQRAIERAEVEPVQKSAPRPWWFRLMAPVAGAAALALFVFTSVSTNPTAPLAASLQDQSHTENGTLTFQSKEHGMTLVWISSGNPAESEASPVAAEADFDETDF